MTDLPPAIPAPVVAPKAPIDAVGVAKVTWPYVLALACLGAVIFDKDLSSSADTVLKLLLGAALMAINPSSIKLGGAQ